MIEIIKEKSLKANEVSMRTEKLDPEKDHGCCDPHVENISQQLLTGRHK